MRTLLELVRRLHTECAIPGNPPATIEGLAAGSEAQRLTDWIIDAWVEILTLHPDYKFRRRSCSFATVDQQGVYTQTQCGLTEGSVGRWILESFRYYTTASGFPSEQYLYEIDYDDWRDEYLFSTNRTNYTQPLSVGQNPSNDGLVIGPIPASGYTIIGDYYLAPTADRLVLNGDTPGLLEKYDSIGIVGKAMIEYGGFEAASDAYQRGQRWYTTLVNRLERELPKISVCRGL
jgi:hypothetical protein